METAALDSQRVSAQAQSKQAKEESLSKERDDFELVKARLLLQQCFLNSNSSTSGSRLLLLASCPSN
jgi:hypothetical protein